MNNQKKRFRRYRKYKCLPHCDILLITIRWFLIAVFAFFGLFCAVLTAFSLWKTVKLPIGCPFLIDNYLFSWCFYFVCRLTISVNGIGRVKKRLCFNWRKLVFGYPTPDIFSVRISCCTPFKREQRAKNCFPGFVAKKPLCGLMWQATFQPFSALPQKTASRFDSPTPTMFDLKDKKQADLLYPASNCIKNTRFFQL